MSKGLVINCLIGLTLTLLACISLYIFQNFKFSVNNDDKDQDLVCQRVLTQSTVSEIVSYKHAVERIVDATLGGRFQHNIWESLATFVDKFGNRIAGSDNLEKSIDYLLSLLDYYELDNVHSENVSVPYWIR